ncbi:hypothetical protein A2165_00500 [Candidatus Curtissbacteria bacterium RBG_13_40_7]|uniref:Sporulation stage II protein D amidase enhancer LytB N-terminal domain-containing protein n=1 Tax=Candidatus Curtissbacteria bacterium RBG_13_40_7 TaxID=1797706 RepID=A0A1F5FVU6_9BACT|nr:MAG: hypothetical protein A2165_00500 [Candidatus Curtissbacteria bacterium RBG_13_40_7]
MKKLLTIFLVILLFSIHYSFFTIHYSSPVRADELEEIQKQIDDLEHQLELSKNATTPLESEVKKLEEQLVSIKARLTNVQKEIKTSEDDLVYQKKVLAQTVRNFYIRSFVDIPLLTFFASEDASETLKLIAFQASSSKEDKNIIREISEKIAKLSDDKKRLASAQAQIDRQSQFLKGEIASAKSFQSQLEGKIAALSARQQEILASRLESLNLPRSAATSMAGCTDDRSIDPGFSPALAFFTYGVPNRVGMNQYGAKGRAEAGQSHEQILRAYYEGINFETKPNITINVDGYGSMQLEQYLLGVYEIPESWPMESLKAQAIAARSYALAYTGNGSKSICTSQKCQVYKGGNKGGNWEQAVKQTEGKVMTNGGSVITAWYSSTHGGYVLKSDEIGWSGTSWTKHAVDTTSGSAGSFGDLTSSAYDKSSPWFYCDWGARSQYNKTAWLKPEEVADIVNALLLFKADGSVGEHLYQTDKPHPYGGEVWNEDRVKQELRNRNINPFGSVSNVSVSVDFGGGRTTSVSISGDAGSVSLSGSELKDMFNLRAPANIQIVGRLFNVEKK